VIQMNVQFKGALMSQESSI